MREYEAEVLFRPSDSSLTFLPEGPYPCGAGQFSWVAIQHGANSTVGSLNIFDPATATNTTHELHGRPGFAFATNQKDTFVAGIERHIGVFNIETTDWTPLTGPIDDDVDGTIINDGLVFDGGLIFGAKDLNFKEKKAGLYLWRRSDRRLIRLRSDQICSNGKALIRRDGTTFLLDIDSPTKTIVEYPLDVAAGKLGEAHIVVDLRNGSVFPDGMILTPDEQSVIVSMYNPADASHGETRQYRLADGEQEAVWKTPGSPQVTCPQLISHDDTIKLVMTTAIEHMPQERLASHPNAGCLFIANTDFDGLPNQPVFEIS